MVGKTIGRRIEESSLPVYVERFGTTVGEVFVTAPELQERFKDRFPRIPVGAIGIYTYDQRVAQGLRQLLCGARQFALGHIARDYIAALTQGAASATGIPMVSEMDREEAENILCGAQGRPLV